MRPINDNSAHVIDDDVAELPDARPAEYCSLCLEIVAQPGVAWVLLGIYLFNVASIVFACVTFVCTNFFMRPAGDIGNRFASSHARIIGGVF